ncbi:MAG: flavin reductase family protein [Candidatus Riflebacteria bacterium]|nr:flavin reductase family protein [Candidatus Riflebacteria bacterium]
MAKKSLPLSKVYSLLESGPTVLVTTARNGRSNIMAMSWHMMIDFEPPLVGCVISDQNYSYSLLKATKECVINIPTLEIAEQTVGCGNTTGAKTDKFATFGLTASPAKQVRAPLIEECYANLECRVVDTKMVNKYGMFVVEVVKAWIAPSVKKPETLHHIGKENFMVAGKHIKLKSKMK